MPEGTASSLLGERGRAPCLGTPVQASPPWALLAQFAQCLWLPGISSLTPVIFLAHQLSSEFMGLAADDGPAVSD